MIQDHSFDLAKTNLSNSSLIRPSYTIRATILKKVFRPEKFPTTEYFPTKRIISLSSRTCKFSSRTCKLYISLQTYILRPDWSKCPFFASLLRRECKPGI